MRHSLSLFWTAEKYKQTKGDKKVVGPFHDKNFSVNGFVSVFFAD